MAKPFVWTGRFEWRHGSPGWRPGRKHDLDREALDVYSLESGRRAISAVESGAFDAEIGRF